MVMLPPMSLMSTALDNEKVDFIFTRSQPHLQDMWVDPDEQSMVGLFKWASAGVVFVIVTALLVAVIGCCVKVAVIVKCWKMAENYTEVASSVDHSLLPSVLPKIAVNSQSQIEGMTMEIFLSNIARERPMRLTPKQIEELKGMSPMILGSGGFGVVYKGNLSYGVPVAVKVLHNHHSENVVREQFMAEVGTLGRISHVNLVKLYGFCFDPAVKALVYEYVENGSLDKLLFGRNKPTVEWEKLHQIAIGTAKGIAYLHEGCQERIIHYDIKPGNVLLDTNLNPKVADFGLAKLYDMERSHVSMTRRGTIGYQAPELGKHYLVTHMCDVYSYGILLLEIVTRRRSRQDFNSRENQEWLPTWTWEMFRKGELSKLLSLCGIEEKDWETAERVVKVALWCIQDLPEQRHNMSDVVKMLEGRMEVEPPPYPFEFSGSTEASPLVRKNDKKSSHSLPSRGASELPNPKPLRETLNTTVTS